MSLDATERALRAEKWAIARQRVAVGTAARTTLARLEVAEASASQLHDQRLTRRAAALTQLATAIGLPTDGLAAIHLAPSADSPAFAPDWPSLHRTVLFDRLDLAEALSTYAEADAIWREQVASRWPDLTLGPGFAFDRGEHKWTLAVSGELPIGGRLDATTTAAQARRSAAAQHVIAVQAQALGRLAQIRTDWEGAQMSIATTDTAVAAQARLVAAVERRWRAGLTPREDWIDAQLELIVQQQSRQDATAQRFAIVDALETTVQRPLWPPSSSATSIKHTMILRIRMPLQRVKPQWLMLALLLSACGRAPAPEPASPAPKPGAEDDMTLMLSAGDAARIGVTTAAMTVAEYRSSVAAVAIVVDPQALFPLLAEQTSAASARSASAANLSRVEALFAEDGNASEQELDAARVQRLQDDARYTAVRRQLQSHWGERFVGGDVAALADRLAEGRLALIRIEFLDTVAGPVHWQGHPLRLASSPTPDDPVGLDRA
ncbi:MAG: TolC family protein [Xanthomonadales bacterium]|nr:TolC family protein [Xanthomonadales bacterium]